MKTIFSALCVFLLLVATVAAQELNPGTTFVDGQRLTAAQLATLVSAATIQPAFYTDKIAETNIGSGDLLLVYSPSSGTFHKVTGGQGIFANPQLISSQETYTSINNTNYYILGYDGTNVSLFQMNVTNFFGTAAPLIGVGGLNFSNILSAYPLVTPTLITNNLQFLVWDTNGVPYQFSISNLINSLAPSLGTNLSLPYNFDQMFAPWQVYGTNGTTNVFGLNVLFPITNIFYTNTTVNLTGTDSIPIYSSLQGSNTTVNLAALYEYFTNLNALPSYTQARIQFSGIPVAFTISNDANTTYGSLSTTNAGYWSSSPPYPALATPYAVSFITNGTGFYFTGAQSNQVYYIVPFATNADWFRVYTNYATAVLQTNWVNITTTGTGRQQMLWLTNYTSFNADVTAVTAGQNVATGAYDIWFRTPSPTPFYYITGSILSYPGGFLGIDNSDILTTFRARVDLYEYNDDLFQPALVHVLISPQ